MTERDIFLATLEITDSTARKAYLDKACVGNAVLRAAVDALFASRERASSFLNTPLAGMPGTISSADTNAEDPVASSSAIEPIKTRDRRRAAIDSGDYPRSPGLARHDHLEAA